MLDEEAQDGSSTKEEEKRAECIGRSFRAHGLKGGWSKFWLHGDMQHLHSGGMLSPKFSSLLYTFLDFFHLPGPPSCQHHCILSLKEHIKWFPNYVLCLLSELDFFSLSCGILSLFAASSTFHNLFVKVYIAGVFRKIDPHGQIGNDVGMDRVLLS